MKRFIVVLIGFSLAMTIFSTIKAVHAPGKSTLPDTNATVQLFPKEKWIQQSTSEALKEKKIDKSPYRLTTPSEMCKPLASRSAISLWMEHIDLIHKSNHLRRDRRWRLHNIGAEILKLISPRLPSSVGTITREWNQVERILKKSYERYDYIKHPRRRKALSRPKPVRILVLGGSVTAGMNCVTGVGGVNNEKCAWPVRLETLINGLAGGALVELKTIATGGTNTKTGQAILEYDLLPHDAKEADILINAYSTNDMHIGTIREAAQEKQTLGDKIFDMIQDFVRTALKPSECGHVPLLIWLDDYVGNEQRKILATTQLSQAIHVLSNYYGFASISYANAVRDLVYGDTHEWLFSPAWYWHAKFMREIHPGQGMHTATAFVIAYNLLNLATTYCSMESWKVMEGEQSMMYNHTRIPGLPELSSEASQQVLYGKPRPKPRGLPPPITKDLNLKHVTDLWRNSSTASLTANKGCRRKEYSRCPFAWILGVPIDGKEGIEAVKEHFARQGVDLGGWELIDDTNKGKYGWMPIEGKIGSEMKLEFLTLSQPIRTVTFFIMKSYGDKWSNSTVLVQVSSRRKQSHDKEWSKISSTELYGFHDKRTSEMYTESIELPTAVTASDSLHLSIRLVNGTTFKIMGLAICS